MKKAGITIVCAFAAAMLVRAQVAKAQSSAPPAGAQSTAKPQSGAAPVQPAHAFKTPKENLSYALGMNIGNNFKAQGIDVDPAVFLEGLKDYMNLSGKKPLMTDDQARATIAEAQKELQAKQAEMMKVLGDKNLKAGAEFLAANKNKPGVIALPSGLQYKILKAGTGAKPNLSDFVVCNYRGTTIDGKEFDSSYKHGKPATLRVAGVIKGWTEALQLMPVGSRWQLFIPANLAYGDRPAGADIGPNSTLIFEIELISITNQPK